MDKSALLRALAPLFPDVSDTERRLQALAADFRDHTGGGGEGEDWQRLHYLAAEAIYLPLWRALAPAYVAALSTPCGDDSEHLQVEVETWPDTVEEHQQHLKALLEQSRLCQAWRDYARFFDADHASASDAEEQDAAEQRFRRSNAPLREIPLYQSSMRVSCQQLVCLPVAQWQALHDPSLQYEPASVDAQVVVQLATRIAQVFNAPPFVDADLLRESCGWSEPVVWAASPGQLTEPTNSHGIRDRCAHGWRGDFQPMADDAVAPHWRYEGFFGRLRVTRENGEDWTVAVLAPLHFVQRMAHSVEWYRQFAPD